MAVVGVCGAGGGDVAVDGMWQGVGGIKEFNHLVTNWILHEVLVASSRGASGFLTRR